MLTLVQTQRIPKFPLILMGRAFWKGLLQWLKSLEQGGFISPGDLDLLTVTDDVDEAIECILEYQRTVGVPASVPKAFA